MKTKITTKPTRKASVSKPATKAMRESVAPGRLPRSRRSAGQVTASASDATQPNSPRRPSKKATIEALVRRREGAPISDLMAAIGWQEHSVRAALTGLRKAGHTVSRSRDAGGTARYRIAGVA